MPIEESIGALEELRTEGKIRLIGVSNFSLAQLRVAQTVTRIVSVQNQYNRGLLIADAVLDACEAEGIAFMPWSPLGEGLRGPAHELRWLLDRSPVILPIPGTSSVEHSKRTCSRSRDARPGLGGGDHLNATMLVSARQRPARRVNDSRDVLYVVLNSDATLTLDDDARTLAAGDALIVDEGVQRALITSWAVCAMSPRTSAAAACRSRPSRAPARPPRRVRLDRRRRHARMPQSRSIGPFRTGPRGLADSAVARSVRVVDKDGQLQARAAAGGRDHCQHGVGFISGRAHEQVDDDVLSNLNAAEFSSSSTSGTSKTRSV